MRYDDRLLTVLSQPTGDRHDSAVRWRQLVDLVSRAGRDDSTGIVAQALDAIRAEAAQVDEGLRAAAARAVAARPLPVGLLEYFVQDRLAVSAPVLAAASLDPAQWRALLSSADDETRRFVETVHPGAGRNEASEPMAATSSESIEPALEALAAAVKGSDPAPRSAIIPAPSLSEVVARIERRRRSREVSGAPPAVTMPDEPPALFRWECGPGGDIAWVDGAPRGALVGGSIARSPERDGDHIDDGVTRAFAMRSPFRDAEMHVGGDGAVAGTWKISGLPAFDPRDGRFAGYRGIALREIQSEPPRRSALDMLQDPASVRELVHEIRTPLNAIVGFAEIIQGQYFGPADHRYRNRAGDIVDQARLLLLAVEDLDFTAKVHGAPDAMRTADVDGVIDGLRETLVRSAAENGVDLRIANPEGQCVSAIEPEVAERLLARFVGALTGNAVEGESLTLSAERADGGCHVLLTRPAKLRGIPDGQLFDGAGSAGQEGLPGFTLRLTRGLARIAGGDILVRPESIALVLPGR